MEKQTVHQCETCGNHYDKVFQVIKDGRSHTFHSFECAIHARAPARQHCGLRIVGHGVEKDGNIFCCAHCAHCALARGARELRDRA